MTIKITPKHKYKKMPWVLSISENYTYAGTKMVPHVLQAYTRKILLSQLRAPNCERHIGQKYRSFRCKHFSITNFLK